MPDQASCEPAARVGIVGAGQLARMSQQAAIGLGVELRVLTADTNAPAVQAGATAVVGSPDSLDDLRNLADGCDVVTFEHELIKPELLTELAQSFTVHPSPQAKLMAQDKLHARQTIAAEGFPVPPYASVTDLADIVGFAEQHGWPLVLKARSGGYDGKGVWFVDGEHEARQVLQQASDADLGLVAEAHIRMERELSVIIARRPGGQTAVYPVFETFQQDGICREVVAPASVSAEESSAAQQLVTAVADHIGLCGLMAVELFSTDQGLMINEFALRPHNSGHLTIDACLTSQFEQHLRAVLDWPLGDAKLIAPAAAMVNVLGPSNGSDPTRRLANALSVPQARVHLYGKAPRPGRKVGHVTALGKTRAEALDYARRAAAELIGYE